MLSLRMVEALLRQSRRGATDVVVLTAPGGAVVDRLRAIPGVEVVEVAEPDDETFRAVDVGSATCVAFVHREDVVNIHRALRVQELAPSVRLVVRLHAPALSGRIRMLLPTATVLSVSATAAPAFVTAAIGARTHQSVDLPGYPMVVADRADVRPTAVVTGLAHRPDRGAPELLPTREAAADLVLARVARHRQGRLVGTRRAGVATGADADVAPDAGLDDPLPGPRDPRAAGAPRARHRRLRDARRPVVGRRDLPDGARLGGRRRPRHPRLGRGPHDPGAGHPGRDRDHPARHRGGRRRRGERPLRRHPAAPPPAARPRRRGRPRQRRCAGRRAAPRARGPGGGRRRRRGPRRLADPADGPARDRRRHDAARDARRGVGRRLPGAGRGRPRRRREPRDGARRPLAAQPSAGRAAAARRRPRPAGRALPRGRGLAQRLVPRRPGLRRGDARPQGGGDGARRALGPPAGRRADRTQRAPRGPARGGGRERGRGAGGGGLPGAPPTTRCSTPRPARSAGSRWATAWSSRPPARASPRCTPDARRGRRSTLVSLYNFSVRSQDQAATKECRR